MGKRKFKQNAQKNRCIVKLMCSIVVVLICSISTILPASAFVFSPIDADVYSMPLDFVFSVESKTAGITEYKLSGYLLSPLIGENIGADTFHDNTVTTIGTNRDDVYESFAKNYYPRAQSLTGNRLLSIYRFITDDNDMYDYGLQRFSLMSNPSVVSLGNEFIHLQTDPSSNTYYNVFVSFDYKIAGDTTVHHYEKGSNSANFVSLIPTASELGLAVDDLIYIYNYFAEVEYFGDPDYLGDVYYPELGISSITVAQKQTNTALFMAENDRLIAGQGGANPPTIDNVWLLNSVTSFFNFEIFPGFSLGGVMGILFAITVLIAVLKFVAGG